MTVQFPRLLVAGSIALALGLTGCKKDEGAAAPAPAPTQAQKAPEAAAPAAGGQDSAITPELRAEAETIFSTRCTPCHGPNGKGDGPASAGLTPPPRNFTDATWQASVTDEHIEKIIQYGGAAVGKSPAMPPNPDLMDKPVVKALREHIRSLKAK